MNAACFPVPQPILCVIPFARSDARQAVQLLEWIRDLGGCRNNPCLLVAANNVWPDDHKQITDLAASTFDRVFHVSPPRPLPDETWPRGANWLFKHAAEFIEREIKRPFWWNEPDCIPLCDSWLQYLEYEYYKVGKAFLGTLVADKASRAGESFGPLVNGGCLYPANTASRFAAFDYTSNLPWDVWMSRRILSQTHNSKLVHHFFGQMGQPPTFAERHVRGEPVNTFTLEQVKPSAVVFHRNKDGTLIDLLRKQTRQITKAPAKDDKIFYHAGNLGDIVYALYAIKKAGGGKLILGPEQIRTAGCERPIDRAAFEQFQPLLSEQRYLRGVDYSEHYPRHVDRLIDLNRFRNNWFNPALRKETGINTLIQMHCYTLGVADQFDPSESWLSVGETASIGKFIVNRTPRYQNPAFPWAFVAHQLKGQLVFVGHDDERERWQREFGPIPHQKVKNHLELARLIASSRGFIGNQSFPCALALGLGVPVLQESCSVSPDCLFKRDNFLTQPLQREQLDKWANSHTVTKPGPRTAISIVCFNRLDLTRKCVELVFKHTRDFFLIITDNASKDGTGAYLADLASKHRNVHVISNTSNLGFKDPQNTAFKMACESKPPFEFFCCLNNDMQVGPGWLDKAIEPLLKDKQIAISGASNDVCCYIEPSFHGSPLPPGKKPDYVEGSLMVIKMDVARKLGMFAPELRFAYGEDSDLSLRARELGYKIALTPLPVKHLKQQTRTVLDEQTKALLADSQNYNHGYLRKRWSAYMRKRNFDYDVLISRRGAMGDVVDLTPCVAALKAKWPLSKIHVKTEVPQVFANNPHVYKAAMDIKGRFDYSFNLDLCYEHRPAVHHVTAYAEALDVSVPLESCRFEIYPTGEDFEAGASLAPATDKRIVAIHMGPTTWPGKDWKPQRWKVLARMLQDEGWSVVTIGAGSWKGETWSLGDGVIDLQHKTSIQALYAFLRRVDLFVGVDSGPSHIAQAAQTPSVVLFGATSPEVILLPQPDFVGVRGDQSKVPCIGEHHRLPPPVTSSVCDGACMDAITPEMVYETIRNHVHS